MSLREFVKELKGSRVEGELIKTIFLSVLTSFFTFVVIYYFRLRNIEGFFSKYGLFLFFVLLSYALILPSVRQVRAFRRFSCMTGMMIGMTIGMMGGFLAGFYVGATNGMFYGGVFGMSIGIIFGVWNGKCCGVMGAMEGLMAGFMGGLMGAMTAVMMFNDNLKAAAVVMFLVCGAILFGLNYLIYKETKGEERVNEDNHFITIFLSFLLTVITMLIMIFGPRSVLFQ